MTRIIAGLAAAFAAVFGVLAFGWGQRRAGAAQARNKAKADDAADNAETLERMMNAPVTLDPVVARERMLKRDPGTK